METNLIEKINKKQTQIEKLERLYAKYADDAEEKAIIDRFLETGDRTEYRAWLRAHNRSYGGDAWSKANDLYDARNTLAKYQKQLAVETAKNATLNNLPETLKIFRDQLIKRWDEYDEWKKATIKEQYKSEPAWNDRENYRRWHYEMRETWGVNWYEFMYLTSEQIHKSNVKDAENLILNLVNRVTERVGTITDTDCLRLDRDNSGYSIINGRIIGTDGECRIESIGAGGYNIQRYHIRVLVH